jgi:hypothetical protein
MVDGEDGEARIMFDVALGPSTSSLMVLLSMHPIDMVPIVT